MRHADEVKKRELAKIHIAIKQLGLDEGTYRLMLMNVAGVSSASELSPQGRREVLKHLESHGFVPTRGKKPYPGTPHNLSCRSKGALLGKIEALLADMALPWGYADGIARQAFKVDKVAWCTPTQLHKVVGVLATKQRKDKTKKQQRSVAK
jgi:phage gp16-like protein